MQDRKIMTVGDGLMGSGIAQTFASAGYEVELYSRKGNALVVEKNLEKDVVKGRITNEQRQAILQKIHVTNTLDAAVYCDVIVEAVAEEKDIKKNLFKQLDGICLPDAIFASNTSSLSITELAAATKRSDKFAGMHFFNPAPVMKLVEIVKGLRTSDATVASLKGLVEGLLKVPIVVQDGTGFLVNRINAALRSEAYRCLEEGVASIEDIDTALKLGLGHPMGPFELADIIGLDLTLVSAENLWDGFKDPKWKPSPLLRKLVFSGDLGRKTSRGWYDYRSGQKRPRTDIKWR